MNKTPLAIIGAGSHTRSLIPLINTDKCKITGIFDDSFDAKTKEAICGIMLAGKITDIPEASEVLISVGDNKKREGLFSLLLRRVYKPNLIHSSAITEKYSHIGRSNQIFAKVFINTGAVIGSNNIVNTGAILEHEVEIGNHNHISVGSILCGRVIIGNCCFIGAGVTVIDKVKICSDVVVGANSTVIKNIMQPGVYLGSPAKRIK